MFQFKPPITPDLSPNAQKDDISFAITALCMPWKWKKGKSNNQLVDKYKSLYTDAEVFTYDQGRTALHHIFKALKLQPGDEVFLQAYTCIVVPNAIKAAGAALQYIDITDNYTIDIDALEAAIQQSRSPKAILLQHTYGIPTDMERLRQLADDYSLYLIEDCAHVTHYKYSGTLLGAYGDAAIFSYGRDKPLSTVSGGIAVVHNEEIAKTMSDAYDILRTPSYIWIKRRLVHPILFAFAKQVYYVFGFGKVVIAVSKKLHVFAWVMKQDEKNGNQPEGFKMPNILAEWAVRQFNKAELYNEHRVQLSSIYSTTLQHLHDSGRIILPEINSNSPIPYLRFPIKSDSSQGLLKYCKEHGILLGDWYRTVIAPASADSTKVQYTSATCVKAEDTTLDVVNLPTNILTTKEDAQKVADVINTFFSNTVV